MNIQESSLNSANIFQNSSNDDFIYRTVLDQSAVLGSLYDARNDSVVGKLSMNKQFNSKILLNPVRCDIIKGDRLKNKNLLDIININKELSLSLILNIISPAGLCSLIDYPYPVNEYTRVIYYYYSSEEKSISNDCETVRKYISKNFPQIITTHIISKITSGIHIIIVLQLLPDNEIELDYLLKRLCEQLIKNTFNITKEQINLLNKIHSTNIYSNIINLNNMTKLTDVCQEIIKIKSHTTFHYPLKYELRPIKWFYEFYPTEKAQYIPINENLIDKLQVYLHSLSHIIKPIDFKMNEILKNQFEKLQQQIAKVKTLYSNQIESIKNLIINIRNGKEQQQTILDFLTNEQSKNLQNQIEYLTNFFNELKNKIILIEYLNTQNIIYFNIEQLNIEMNDNLNDILKNLPKNNDQENLIFCSNDNLNRENLLKWIKEYENNSKFQLIYADFSYCPFQLSEIQIISSKDLENKSSINYINVLLLGESGVGKSTLINALVNYLAYKNIDEARLNKPIILMPVSFLITTGDNFEEHIIKYGNNDSNENYNYPGQSVTQQCRSYIIDIDNNKKLRLIDTPGIGDTRGLDQDDKNIHNILSFINNLEHINAICILLKPNEARLNIVFRLYFNNLLNFLGKNIRNNIIFCFTNCRTTFYAPGNSGPLLKSMIRSNYNNDIPFQKSNTFCFDSESFRYLIALKNGISFDDYQEKEYKQSWKNSLPESIRMFKYICTKLEPYSKNQWQSIKHVQFEIIQMIRPILETLRNIYRNLILIEQISTNKIIKLYPKISPQFSTICYNCIKHSPELFYHFGIIIDYIHIFQDKCDKCQCDFKDHIPIEYTFDYELSNIESNDEMKSTLTRIKNAIQGFAQIFCESDQIDPILFVLDRIINEENYICTQIKSNNFNALLCNKLINLKKEYEEIRTKFLTNRKDIDLTSIYSLIENIKQIELVNKQINIIKQVKYKYFEQHQIQVPYKLTLN